MNYIAKCILVGLIGGVMVGQQTATAKLEVSASVSIHAVSDFHAPLAAHGTWIEVGTHGRCWRPAHIAVGWQPYSVGRWVWTDCGWYWASDEPWGWACYHYGSWVHDSHVGWVWVPGIEWAPAWVEWRYGGGYCGWAPIGPRGVVIAPRSYVFVEVGRFHEPVRPGKVIVHNTTIINKTTVVGGSKREARSFDGASRQVVINDGPGVDEIQKATGQSFKSVSVREAAGHDAAPSDAVTKINESRKKEKTPAVEQQPAVDKQPGPDKKQPDLDKKAPAVEPKPDGRNVPPSQPVQPAQPQEKDKAPEGKNPENKGADQGVAPPNGAPPTQQPPAPDGQPKKKPVKPTGKEKGNGKATDKDAGKGKDKH
jgi:hypothetical protein